MTKSAEQQHLDWIEHCITSDLQDLERAVPTHPLVRAWRAGGQLLAPDLDVVALVGYVDSLIGPPTFDAEKGMFRLDVPAQAVDLTTTSDTVYQLYFPAETTAQEVRGHYLNQGIIRRIARGLHRVPDRSPE